MAKEIEGKESKEPVLELVVRQGRKVLGGFEIENQADWDEQRSKTSYKKLVEEILSQEVDEAEENYKKLQAKLAEAAETLKTLKSK